MLHAMTTSSDLDAIEIIRPDFPKGQFRAVLFDFDGTLSLIRRNWQAVMIPMMVDELARYSADESRDELASVSGWLAPSDAFIPPILLGAVERPLFDPSADMDAAETAMDGAPGGVAVMAIPPDCPECQQTFELIRDRLAPLGIDVQGRSFDDPYSDLYAGHAPFDMIPMYTGGDTADGASFLSNMLGNDIPGDWLPAGVAARVDRLLDLRGVERDRATSALAEELTRDVVPAVAYGTQVTAEFFSPRLGCRVFPPLGFGVDLASLCLVEPSPSGV